MMAKLAKEKIPRSVLQRVHAPIGVHIHSHTPEEIAVSIAAEIIAEKNGSGINDR
jgi:xanthine dehydrogenase accessory factor